MTGSTYSNTAVYLEGSQQVVTGNTFLASPTPLIQNAGTAIETHGGRSTISNNTSNNYATLVKVVPTSPTIQDPPLSPNDVVVGNNSVTCAQNGITMAGLSGHMIQNVSITGNTIHVCNNDRLPHLGIDPTIFTGIRYDGSQPGDVDGLVISNNVIAMQSQQAVYTSGSAISNGGILLNTAGNLSNVGVSGNIVTNSPVSGIRVGSTSGTAQRVRITDNTIVDAGNNNQITSTTDAVYRHAIGLTGLVKDADVARNMIYDTGNPVLGKYSLYLQQANNSINVRTSQNTVHWNPLATSSALRAVQNGNSGLVDATGANDVFISPPITGGTQQFPATVNVDFMSFTRYIAAITQGPNMATAWVNVLNPLPDASSIQWTVGQQVTFRFSCPFAYGCTVLFDGLVSPSSSAYSTNGPLTIGTLTGKAITFQVESFGPSGHRFYELYRTPDPGIPN